MYPDLSLTTVLSGDEDRSRYRDVLIHELTHVWQYYNGYWVAPRSFYAQEIGKGYHYTLDPKKDCWNDFNVEQQASIVEHWFSSGMSEENDRYPFIDMIIRGWNAGETKTLVVDKLAATGKLAAPADMTVQELREFMKLMKTKEKK